MQGLLDFFGLGGGGASPATPPPQMFGFPGMTPEEQAFVRQRSMNALLGTIGPSLMAASQGGIPLAQAGALRAQAMSQAAQAPMAAMQAGDQAGQQMLQQRMLRTQIAQREAQMASGARMANWISGGATAAPAAPGAGVMPTAAPSATPAVTTSAPQPVDLDLAARVLHFEAGNQGPEGLAAVAHVMRNRANLTGRSLADVVSQPGQFEPFATRRDQINALRPEQYADARRVLEGVVAGDIPDPTRGATHFLNPELVTQRGGQRPAWAPEGQGMRIGAHEFFSIPQDFRQAGGATPASVPAGSAPLSPQQAALVAPVNGAAPRTPGFNGNSVANMPAELRVLAADAFNRGDLEAGERIVSGWLTRNPSSVQTAIIGGRVVEIRPDATLGRDFGPATDRGPVMSETQIAALGVPAASARMIASLGTREEQDQAIRAFATREQPRLAEQEDPLRGEFLRQPQVQRFTQSIPLYGTIHTALDRIETGARTGQYDQVAALDAVFALANILDPGSVVRGEEVVTIQRTSGLPGWMQAQIARVNQGAALTTATIAQMRSVADDRMQVYRNEVNEVGSFYTGLATRRGLDPQNVVPGFRDVVAERRAAAEAARANNSGSEERPARPARPPGVRDEQIAAGIRRRLPGDTPDAINARRAAARAAGINPSLVE
ncbi:Cell wall hydrolase, SleB [uncultured Caudovirales phage]|uniref:Cell wall hydrolase, SleB n=1 Tax=uncultured Caudovirales phage TaxID=2100421 RepID=A0A6J5M1I1_9CAUD|nr:Cell wall hydrolase, SleB [uncultured Caudovirales phage]